MLTVLVVTGRGKVEIVLTSELCVFDTSRCVKRGGYLEFSAAPLPFLLFIAGRFSDDGILSHLPSIENNVFFLGNFRLW